MNIVTLKPYLTLIQDNGLCVTSLINSSSTAPFDVVFGEKTDLENLKLLLDINLFQ